MFGIITHYDVHNHGALLQLTALIRVLKSKGIEARALQFDKNYDFMGLELKAKYNVSIKSVGIYIDYIRQKGLKCFIYNFKKRKTLEKYKKDNDLIGPFYTICPPLEGVIIGSDEVFALHTGITPVMFGLCCPSENVFAYAASFGPTKMADVSNHHCKEIIACGLEGMLGVSVRDKNSQDLVKELTGINAKLVVDPVILYGFKREIENMPRPIENKYLLVYAYDKRMNDRQEVEKIKAYAKEKGLILISPGFFHSWCDINVNTDPIKLLSYFKNAEAVITDTFHGTVMSLITGVNVSVKLRDNSNKLFNLMLEYGIENKEIKSFDSLRDVVAKEINWSEVNTTLEYNRKDSMTFLNEMIEKCK